MVASEHLSVSLSRLTPMFGDNSMSAKTRKARGLSFDIWETVKDIGCEAKSKGRHVKANVRYCISGMSDSLSA